MVDLLAISKHLCGLEYNDKPNYSCIKKSLENISEREKNVQEVSKKEKKKLAAEIETVKKESRKADYATELREFVKQVEKGWMSSGRSLTFSE